MERRLSERVQFFRHPGNHSARAWGEDQGHSESITALLLDVSDDGVRIVTDQAIPQQTDTFELRVQADDAADAPVSVATMRRLWSRTRDNDYIHHGFSFDGDVHLTALLDSVLAARDDGKQWMRCDLVPVSAAVHARAAAQVM